MSLYVQSLGEGPDLVLLHGWGMHGGVWQPVLERLTQKFRVHVFDLPGLGNSAAVSPYTLQGLAEAVAGQAPEGAAVCGWSMGGLVAMRWALDRPGSLRRLLLVGTTPRYINGDGWDCGIDPDVFRQFAAQVEADYQGTLTKFLSLQAHGGDAPKDTIRRLRESFFERGRPRGEDLQAGLEILLETDLRAAVPGLKLPVLVLHGDYDRLAPVAAGRWLAEHLPDAGFALCPGASHAPFLSHPDWFVRQVEAFAGG